VETMLHQYYIGEVESRESYYKWDSEFYAVLKARVDAYMKTAKLTRSSNYMYIQTLVLLLLWSFAYYIGMVKGFFLGAVLLGFAHSEIGINIMHDGNHGAFSSNKIICSLAAFAMDLMGSSSIVWVHQHNVGHHPNANTMEPGMDASAYDPDGTAGYPYIRHNPHQEWKWFHRYQHLYTWFLIMFINFKWFFNDMRSMIRGRYTLIDFYGVSRWEVGRLFLTKALFLSYAFIVPIYAQSSIARAIFLSCTFMVVSGYVFVLMFSVNHLTENTAFPDDTYPFNSREWAILQVLTSSNFAIDSIFWTIVSGGLNFQIEHHLFPGVNHFHLAKISPIVQQTCKEFGIPYQLFPSFSSALGSYYSHLRNMGVDPSRPASSGSRLKVS